MEQRSPYPSSPIGASKSDSPDEIRRRKEVAARNYEKRHQMLAKEQEERQRKTAMERTRISRELKEREARELKKQKEILQKRMELLRQNKKREEEVLALNHASSSRTAVKKNFAFGSSTPRELSYLDQLPRDQKAYDKKLVPIVGSRDTSMNESLSAARSSHRSVGASSLMSTSMYVPSSPPRPPRPRLPVTPKVTPCRPSVAPRTPASVMTQSVHSSLTASAPHRAVRSTRTMSTAVTPIPSRVRPTPSGPSKMTATAPNTPGTQTRPPRMSMTPTMTSRQAAAGKLENAGTKAPSVTRRSLAMPPIPPASRNNQKPAAKSTSTTKAASSTVPIIIRRPSVVLAETSEREDTSVDPVLVAVEQDTREGGNQEMTTVSALEPVVLEEQVLPVHSVAVVDADATLDAVDGEEDNHHGTVSSLTDELQSLDVQPRAISESDLVGGLSEEEFGGYFTEQVVGEHDAGAKTATTEQSSEVEAAPNITSLINFAQTEPVNTEKIDSEAGCNTSSSAVLAATNVLENELFALPGAVSVPTPIASVNVDDTNIEIVNSLNDAILDAVSATVNSVIDKSAPSVNYTALLGSAISTGSMDSLNSSSPSSSRPVSRAASANGTEQASETRERISGSSEPTSKPPTPPLVLSSVEREAIQKRAEENKKQSEEISARLAAVMARTRGGRTSPPSTAVTPAATATPSSTPANESGTPSESSTPSVGLSSSTAALLQKLRAKGQAGNGVTRILERHASDPKLDVAPNDPVVTANQSSQQ